MTPRCRSWLIATTRDERSERASFFYSGRKLVIRDAKGDVLFGWVWGQSALRMDGQEGYNCAIFRNESTRRSSEIILECEQIAFAKWGKNRMFTYVNPKKIRSSNPGCCFKKAGWKHIGLSKGGLILLAKEFTKRMPC